MWNVMRHASDQFARVPLSTLRSLILSLALVFSLVMALLMLSAGTAGAASRIKDIAVFGGIRDNQLVGYGLVVGLNGDGDTLNTAIFTRESLVGMLERLGVRTRENITALKTDNIAAVMVTANLPPFARQGTRIDVNVGTMGDAESLLGGQLLVTPLMGADGEVYAVAQGPVVAGGFAAGGAAETVTKGVPTSGRIPNGAIVEREVGFELSSLDNVNITLRNPDFTTASRIANAINAFLGVPAARSLDPSTVNLSIPATHAGDLVGLLTDIEQLHIQPDTPARVVIDETSGVIVIGQNVRIDPVAIAQGNLTIRVTEAAQVSQPLPFAAAGETVVVPRTVIEITEGEERKLALLDTGVTLQDLVNGLNALGIGPRDMITILQAIKVSGALHAEIKLL